MVSRPNGVAVPALLYMQQPDGFGQPDPREYLETWEHSIGVLDQALADATAARAAIDIETALLDRIEASTMLTIEGGNAETRKARLTLALADDAGYQAHLGALKAARERQADADRRIAIARERCRLLRATLALYDRAE